LRSSVNLADGAVSSEPMIAATSASV